MDDSYEEKKALKQTVYVVNPMGRELKE